MSKFYSKMEWADNVQKRNNIKEAFYKRNLFDSKASDTAAKWFLFSLLMNIYY
jgi:hypothetical protein